MAFASSSDSCFVSFRAMFPRWIACSFATAASRSATACCSASEETRISEDASRAASTSIRSGSFRRAIFPRWIACSLAAAAASAASAFASAAASSLTSPSSGAVHPASSVTIARSSSSGDSSTTSTTSSSSAGWRKQRRWSGSVLVQGTTISERTAGQLEPRPGTPCMPKRGWRGHLTPGGPSAGWPCLHTQKQGCWNLNQCCCSLGRCAVFSSSGVMMRQARPYLQRGIVLEAMTGGRRGA
mmetsp:Transcript_13531/g.33767  ORF Transcript_13531/g.33767 Transcript_13531/m.33767 type:complete len:242 (-) Transcript_13531:117-842(-)